ncbi:terminase large subunit domain-containing protein [Sphingomonas hengshuiensis]|uniref:terminase large subunit domain-containing protein n=1 Tax=Sphingomonas hengshuiensis TaxID=1609977 RepID=UPI0009820E5C|nr:terminase family protein [Sphingomonas hengshuiensis]
MADIVVGDELARLIHFTPYQRAWLADKSRFKAGMFARQTGKTFGTCAELVEDCIEAEIARKRTRWVILSRGERQAKEAMDENVKPMTRAFWELYRGLMAGPAPEVEEGEWKVTRDDGTDATYKQFEVVYPGGSRITALPANPDTARGFSSNVLFDEFAFHANSKAIWGAAYPIISKGWKVRVVSTPNGKSNKFYDIMTEDPTIWSRHIVDIHQAVAQGLDRNIDELRAGLSDPDLWAQEYELQWRDELSAWLDYFLISQCETPGYGRIREMEFTEGKLTHCVERGTALPPARGRIFAGMDIAAKKDLTCIWTAEEIGDVLYPREIVTMRRAPFAAQYAEIERMDARDNWARFAGDETGMGIPVLERIREILGASRVDGITFSMSSKLGMATLLKDRMQDRLFRLVEGDKATREDLHSITRVVTETGAIRLLNDGESDGHGDRFWAAALCCVAASGQTQQIGYLGIPKAGFGDDPRADRDLHDAFAQRHGQRATPAGRFGSGSW